MKHKPLRIRSNSIHHTLLVSLLLVLVFLVYAKSLSFPFTDWDDPSYVTGNRLIRSLALDNLTGIFSKPYYGLYIPVTLASYALDYHWFHLNPFGYHLVNVFLHLLNVVLVYAAVNLLTGDWLVGLATAVLFGIHPVQVESVVWIAERKNVLASFFFLSAFLAYFFACRESRKKTVWLGTSLVLFALSCFAKPTAVVLPILLIAFDLSYSQRGAAKGVRYLSFLSVALLCVAVNVLARHGEGKIHYVVSGSFWKTMLGMAVAMMRYFELLFLPLRQSLLYRFPVYNSLGEPAVALSLAGLLLLAAGLGFLWRKDRKLFFWGAWYLTLLLPVMNLVPFPSLMNDRYLYLPLVGIFTLLSILARRAGRPAVAGLALILCVSGFTFLNVHRQEVWRDLETLWLDTQDKTQGKNQVATFHLAQYYLAKGDPQRTKIYFQKLLSMLQHPEKSEGLMISFAHPWDREKILGQYHLFATGETDKAIGHYQKVVGMTEDAEAYGNLGIAWLRKGALEKAGESFKKAAALAPENPHFHANLALVYSSENRWDLGVGELRKALSLQPGDAVLHNNLASFLIQLGRKEEAEKEFLEALAVNPGFAGALYNIGLLYYEGGNFEDAERYWMRLLQFYPNHERAGEIRERLKERRHQNGQR